MIVCVAANPSIDKLFEVERLVLGDIHRPTGFVQTAGGKGFNVARAAHSLGADVRVAAILRDTPGDGSRRRCRPRGSVARSSGPTARTDPRCRSPTANAGTLTEFYEHGPDTPVAVWPEFVDAASRLFRPESWLTISGSMPRGLPEDGYCDLVAEARAAGMRVALDAEGEALRLALEAGPEIVKVNVAEAVGLLGGRWVAATTHWRPARSSESSPAAPVTPGSSPGVPTA